MIYTYNTDIMYARRIGAKTLFTDNTLPAIIEREKDNGVFLFATKDTIPCENGNGTITIEKAYFLKK